VHSVSKYLAYEYVPIVERTFRSGTRESCVAQLSIYVILRGNEETRRYINQVRSAMRHLMSNIICDFTVIQGSFSNFLFLWYSSRQHRNVIFVHRLKSYEVTILKFSRIYFSDLKLTSLISRDKWSSILHSHNTLPLLLQFVSFFCAENPIDRDKKIRDRVLLG